MFYVHKINSDPILTLDIAISTLIVENMIQLQVQTVHDILKNCFFNKMEKLCVFIYTDRR